MEGHRLLTPVGMDVYGARAWPRSDCCSFDVLAQAQVGPLSLLVPLDDPVFPFPLEKTGDRLGFGVEVVNPLLVPQEETEDLLDVRGTPWPPQIPDDFGPILNNFDPVFGHDSATKDDSVHRELRLPPLGLHVVFVHAAENVLEVGDMLVHSLRVHECIVNVSIGEVVEG